MFDAAHIYGFDIETDNTTGMGLVPRKSSITQVALATADKGFVFEGAEVDILLDLADVLGDLGDGMLATWNGAFFDVPFVHDRLSILAHDSTLDELQRAKVRYAHARLRMWHQVGLSPKYSYLPGHVAGYAAVWFGHTHFDISMAYRQFAADQGVSWSLKPVLRAAGFDPVELDRTRLHEYTSQQVADYVLSDAVGARNLTLRTFGLS